jgi:hypothetical protein
MPTKKTTRTTTTVSSTTATVRLTDEEERVLRMRVGRGVPRNQPLGLKHTETDKAREALLAIERELVMKMHAGREEQRSRKAKIIDSLRSVSGSKKK